MKILIMLLAAMACSVRAQTPATLAHLATLAAHGEKHGVQLDSIINGFHSGDIQIPITLTPPAPAGAKVRLSWCFKQNGFPITFPGGVTYFTRDPEVMADDSGREYLAVLPFSYRLFEASGQSRTFPALSAGLYQLECFIGHESVMQVSPPASYWGSVTLDLQVLDQKVYVAIPDHRNLLPQTETYALLVRSGPTGNSCAYNVKIVSGDQHVELASSLAVIPANSSHTLVQISVLTAGEFRVYAEDAEGLGTSGFSQMAMGGDTIRGPHDCLPGPDLRPRPYPWTWRDTMYELGVNSAAERTGGALPAGANPIIFCGSCDTSNSPIPPECAGNPLGQAFVEQGRCKSSWSWYPYGNGNSCECEFEEVASAKYVMTAGALPTDCPLGASISFYVGLEFEPYRICCTWNRLPGQDMEGTYQVLICKTKIIPPPE